MSGKRILYLSYDGMTDPLGQSQVLPYLKGLSQQGAYQFTLLSCEKPERFAQHRERLEGITREAGIEWHPLPYTKRPPIVSTLADLRRMRKLALKLHQEKPFDAVHCRGHVTSLVGLFLKKKFGIKFLFDNRGFWADEKVDAGAWDLKKPVYNTVYRYFKRKEKEMIEQCDQQVCLTHSGKADMLRWKHVQARAERITVIPCCADTGLFSPETAADTVEKFRTELGLHPGGPVLAYLGSIGTWYMLDEMLDFFVAYRKALPDARFLFITQDEHERIRQTAAAKGLPAAAILIRPGMRHEVPGLLALAQHSLFFIRPTYSKISSSPTKQGEIMAMGIPVVCNAGVGDSDQIISEYKSGILVRRFEKADYERAAQELLQTSFYAPEIRRGAERVFSLSSGVDKYLEVYKNMFR
ncbi:MAG: glycosyltransferase [Bacteroidetes bacterium]|nr:glycosyltransferase [Bacteroidota bacterium]